MDKETVHVTRPRTLTCDCHPGCIAWHTLDGRIRGSEQPIEGRCGAHLSRTNPPRYCQRHPITGRYRCKRHGGKIARGALSHAATKGGEFSAYLQPGPLADGYARANAERRHIHELGEILAMHKGFLHDAATQLHGLNLSTMVDALASLPDALTREDAPITPTEAASILRDAVTTARSAMAAERRFISVSRDVAKLIETDLRRQAQQEQLVTRDQAVAYAYAIADGMRRILERLGAQPADLAEAKAVCQDAAARWLLGADPRKP